MSWVVAPVSWQPFRKNGDLCCVCSSICQGSTAGPAVRTDRQKSLEWVGTQPGQGLALESWVSLRAWSSTEQPLRGAVRVVPRGLQSEGRTYVMNSFPPKQPFPGHTGSVAAVLISASHFVRLQILRLRKSVPVRTRWLLGMTICHPFIDDN